MVLILIFAFILGTAIGSFLNVVAYRYNTGLSIAHGRSRCFTCSRNLSWYELVPVFSFLMQKGKCRNCKSKISWQYPVVELVTGLLFVAIVVKVPPLTAGSIFFELAYAVIWSILVVIVVYDLRHKIIPDLLAFLFGLISFVLLFIKLNPAGALVFQTPTVWQVLAGPLLFLPFFLLWLVSGGRWLGLGDAKLAVGIGWSLGLVYGISALVLAFWSGALVGIILIVLQKILKHAVFHKVALFMGLGERIMKSEIPFAPFLVLGMAIVFWFRIDIMGLSALFSL